MVHAVQAQHLAVTAEVASSSLVVPPILFMHKQKFKRPFLFRRLAIGIYEYFRRR
jgi:hypothetical protein